MTAPRRILNLDPDTPEFHDLATLLSEQRNLVLATCSGDGRPHCSLMAHCVTADLRTVILASPEKTRKVDNIRANPAVSLLVTDQTESRGADAPPPVAVTITGRAEILPPEEARELGPLFPARHPALAGFWDAPTTVAIRVTVSRIMLVRRFAEITEFLP